MRQAKWALVALALLCASGAQAMATATIEITNQTDYSAFIDGARVTGTQFDYTITVSDDGMTAWPGDDLIGQNVQPWGMTYPSSFQDVGSAQWLTFTGHEVAYAGIYTYLDYPGFVYNPAAVFDGPNISLQTVQDDHADFQTVSGHAVAYVGLRSQYVQADIPAIRVSTLTMALSSTVAPVPESSTWALMLAGLAFVASRLRSTRHAQN